MTFFGAGDEVGDLARGLETLESTLEALCGKLRDLNLADTGPDQQAQAFTQAVASLERELGQVGAQSRDAAVVVRRFISEEET